MKRLLKNLARGVCIALALPLAVFAGFGRFQGVFTLFAQLFALGPGVIGIICGRVIGGLCGAVLWKHGSPSEPSL
jgi:hypothetical protein